MGDFKEKEVKGTWSGKLDFTMSALSFAVGMGNLWRFPYLVFRSGGGAFLIPYLLTMFFCGYPLMLIELAVGQYSRKGIIGAWGMCPIFEGIGWGMFSVSVFTAIYYNMIIAWTFFYLFASLAKDVPWRYCDHDWNTAACTSLDTLMLKKNCTNFNGTFFNDTCVTEQGVGHDVYQQVLNITNMTAGEKRTSPSGEFFHRYMLDISEGFHEMGGVRWQLALCLLFCWVLVFVCLARGIQVSGKVTYVTALFPYVVLTILLIRGLTLEGAVDGVLYYIMPDFKKLMNARVWGDAAVQAFFSLSLCWGGLVSLASYNKFHNDMIRDTIVVATGDMLTSIYSGFAIFSIIGYMAHELGVPVSEVAAQGPGLAFVVYPEVVTKLPVSPLWSVIFMLMLINVGVGSQITLTSTVHQLMLEKFPGLFGAGKRPILTLLAICGAGYLLGLSLTTRGGIYMLLLMDSYSATYALLGLAFAECIAVGWVYGFNNFYEDMQQMLGRRPSIWWSLCWRFFTPGVILFIMMFVFIDFHRSSYTDYVFPLHWDLLGWSITFISMLCVPVVAIVKLMTTERNKPLRERLRTLTSPKEDWHYQEPLDDEQKETEVRKKLTNGGGGTEQDENEVEMKLMNGNEKEDIAYQS